MSFSGSVSQLRFARRFFLAEDAHIHALPGMRGIMFEEQFTISYRASQCRSLRKLWMSACPFLDVCLNLGLPEYVS